MLQHLHSQVFCFFTVYNSCIDGNGLCVCINTWGKKVTAMLSALEHFDNDNCIFIFVEVDQQLLARCRDGLLLSAQMELKVEFIQWYFKNIYTNVFLLVLRTTLCWLQSMLCLQRLFLVKATLLSCFTPSLPCYGKSLSEEHRGRLQD